MCQDNASSRQKLARGQGSMKTSGAAVVSRHRQRSRDGALLDNPICEQMLRVCMRVNGEHQVNLCLRSS
jgi:hypothetical protein